MGHLNVLKFIVGHSAPALAKSWVDLQRRIGKFKPPRKLAAGTIIELGVAGFADIPAARAALQRLSRDHDLDFAWIAATSVTDAFIYSHFRNGAEVRGLALGEAGQFRWDHVVGQPEPWEKQAFEGESVMDTRGRKVLLVKRDRWPKVGDTSLGADALGFANAALDHDASPEGGQSILPPLSSGHASSISWLADPARRRNPWKHLPEYAGTTLSRLEDRYLCLISGTAQGSDQVYRVVGLPLDAGSSAIGQLAIEGLSGSRKISVKEERAARAIGREYPEKAFELIRRSPAVTLVWSDGRLELRIRPGTTGHEEVKKKNLEVPRTPEEMGRALTAAFATAMKM